MAAREKRQGDGVGRVEGEQGNINVGEETTDREVEAAARKADGRSEGDSAAKFALHMRRRGGRRVPGRDGWETVTRTRRGSDGVGKDVVKQDLDDAPFRAD